MTYICSYLIHGYYSVAEIPISIYARSTNVYSVGKSTKLCSDLKISNENVKRL